MPLSQKGANYLRQTEIKRRDRALSEALDDIASQIQSVRSQANFGQAGTPDSPSTLSSITVAASGGFGLVTLTHQNAPAGTRYVIEYSTTPNFQSPVRIDNGISLTWHQYLTGLTLYFRAAPTFLSSALAPWIYFGDPTNPTAVTF